MKKSFFSIAVVVLLSSFVLCACGKPQDKVEGNYGSLQEETIETPIVNISIDVPDIFVEYVMAPDRHEKSQFQWENDYGYNVSVPLYEDIIPDGVEVFAIVWESEFIPDHVPGCTKLAETFAFCQNQIPNVLPVRLTAKLRYCQEGETGNLSCSIENMKVMIDREQIIFTIVGEEATPRDRELLKQLVGYYRIDWHAIPREIIPGGNYAIDLP